MAMQLAVFFFRLPATGVAILRNLILRRNISENYCVIDIANFSADFIKT